jgi:hypothetical protein
MSGTAADFVTPTPPARCALAVAVPLTKEAFQADLDAGAAMDFSRKELLRGKPPDDAWRENGLALAALCREMCTEAAGLGVTVVESATLDRIPALFAGHEVVTILGHWRGPDLLGADFRVDPRAFVDWIYGSSDPLGRAIVDRLRGAALEQALKRPERRAREAALAELVDTRVIAGDEPLPGALPPGPVLIDRPSLQARHRAMLDAAYPDMLEPGNRVELRDGLHSAEALAACLPPDWAGIADLALCQSAYVAHVVKGGRTGIRVVLNKNEVILSVRLRMLRALYRMLAKNDCNYGAGLIDLFRRLGKME